MNMPGFTAESILARKGHFATHASARVPTPGEGAVIPQARASEMGGAGGPFSGWCVCGPGWCCCRFCYFDNCYFWCRPTFVGGFGLSGVSLGH
jgi:hypothetical protein